MPQSAIIAVIVVLIVLGSLPIIVNGFLRNVDAGEIRLVSWLNGRLQIYRGPCKALMVPMLTVSKVIPASAINVDIEITDQTSDIDANGKPAPVKVTVKASAIVSVGEDEAMVATAANKFFSKPPNEQLSTLTDVLSSAGRRAINLLKHDQLFNARSGTALAAPTVAALPAPDARTAAPDETALTPAGSGSTTLVSSGLSATESAIARGDDDELAVIIKDACSRELLDLGLSFNSLNIKGVQSEVAEARRRESAARAKASADVVQAQEEQRARIAQLEAQQKINDQERALNTQIASNGAAIARAEAEKQTAVQQQREAELAASQITQARADAEQNIIKQEAEGKAQAALIRSLAQADADAIHLKAEALMQAGQAYLDLRRLELAPQLTREVAAALSSGQFVNFGTTGSGGQSAASAGSDDVLRVVQTLMAAQIVTNAGGGILGTGKGDANGGRETATVEPPTRVTPRTAPTPPRPTFDIPTPRER